MNWKDIAEIVYYVAGTVGALGTFAAAGFAAYFYYRNSQLEREVKAAQRSASRGSLRLLPQSVWKNIAS